MIYFYGIMAIIYVIVGCIIREVIQDDLCNHESFTEFLKDKSVGSLILLLIFSPIYVTIELLFKVCSIIEKIFTVIFNSKIMKHKPFKKGDK